MITGNVIKDAGSPTAVLGLIGNQFVRIRHYYKSGYACGNTSSQTGTDVTQIDAAILALNNSFIVDRYNCGAKLGSSPNYYLTVNGVIAQKYRGPVGTGGSIRQRLHQELQLRLPLPLPDAAALPGADALDLAHHSIARADAGLRLPGIAASQGMDALAAIDDFPVKPLARQADRGLDQPPSTA